MAYALALEGMARATETSVELADAPLLPGWKVLSRAGRGASSTVWRVRQTDRGTAGAAKVARREPAALDAVAQETRLLSRIAPRWAPALLDAGPGFLVTDWVEGVALAVETVAEDREYLATVCLLYTSDAADE